MRIKFIIIFIIALISFSTTTEAISFIIDNPQEGLLVVDKEKSYPKRTLELESEVTVIPLETSEEILIDGGLNSHVYYISDTRMLITNNNLGDVFIFDIEGNAVSHFNETGGMGYTRIKYACYDEKNEEVYILDLSARRRILVFSEGGSLKRTLRLPDETYITEINIFNDSLLLAYHEYQYGPLLQKQPYMLVSKKDGSIDTKLNIILEKANPRTLKNGDMYTTLSGNYYGNCKYGDEFILFNMSCDTVYQLNKDKTVTPLFVQQPTVFTDPPYILSVRMKTDDFMILYTYTYDFKKGQREGNTNHRTKHILYDFNTGEFWECRNLNSGLTYTAEKTDILQNMSIEKIDAFRIKDLYNAGRLDGELEQIASQIEVDDNPVIIMNRFKY